MYSSHLSVLKILCAPIFCAKVTVLPEETFDPHSPVSLNCFDQTLVPEKRNFFLPSLSWVRDGQARGGKSHEYRSLQSQYQVAGAAIVFEVQRSSRSEAGKEELRRREIQAMKQRAEDLAREIELVKEKIVELEQLSKGRGLGESTECQQ